LVIDGSWLGVVVHETRIKLLIRIREIRNFFIKNRELKIRRGNKNN